MKKAIIDIDGVLNYYPQTYIDFCNDKFNENFKTLSEIKNKLSYNLYKKTKEEYRQSDYKHKAKLREDAARLFNVLKYKGYLIFIVTSRDLFVNNQLERTLLWLRENNIQYDYIYRSIKKDFTIFEKFGHVDLVIEDSMDNLENIMKINGNAKYYNIINCENETIFIDGIKKIEFLQTIINDVLEENKDENKEI